MAHDAAHSLCMATLISISGALDRREPDPSSPLDRNRAFLGLVVVTWTMDRPRSATAAILQVKTGGGAGYHGWGDTTLCLNWIGDETSPEIARAVYDVIQDRGPVPGSIRLTLEATERAPELGSYSRARRAS